MFRSLMSLWEDPRHLHGAISWGETENPERRERRREEKPRPLALQKQVESMRGASGEKWNNVEDYGKFVDFL